MAIELLGAMAREIQTRPRGLELIHGTFAEAKQLAILERMTADGPSG